jgi:hypothetical protein
MIAACSQALNQLLTAEKRELVEKAKLEKARKSALRTVELLFTQPTICMMTVLNKTFAEFEKQGGSRVHHTISPTKINSIASIAAQIYGTVIVPYVKVDSKKPINCYYSVAVMYMLSSGTFGRALHLPVLSAMLPDEKSLKNLGFIVSRMTGAKRYILDALNHYLRTNKRLRSLPKQPETQVGSASG